MEAQFRAGRFADFIRGRARLHFDGERHAVRVGGEKGGQRSFTHGTWAVAKSRAKSEARDPKAEKIPKSEFRNRRVAGPAVKVFGFRAAG